MQNKIIVRYTDGKLLKGTTADLFPNKAIFHIKEHDSDAIQEINITYLKAVYFVKTYEGDPDHHERNDIERVGMGKKIEVSFKDGETLVGYTQGYSPVRDIFIVFPSDPDSNNEKVFVIAKETSKVTFI
jgi:small nuclear ribonucleoprotein (snRNP)-like protein